MFEPAKRLSAGDALEHKWMRSKRHKKLNLQRSISSNWSESCVSLKNEKGLERRQSVVKDTATKSSSKKLMHKAKIKSYEGTSRGNGRAEYPKGANGSPMDLTNIMNTKRGREKSDSQSVKDPGKKQSETLNDGGVNSKTRPINKQGITVSPVEITRSEKSFAENNGESKHERSARDYNGNLRSEKHTTSSTRPGKTRADGTTTSRCNLNDSSLCEDAVTERSPLNKPRANKKAALPPIQGRFPAPRVTAHRAVKL